MSTQSENAGSKSLMKKTKVELVDIILRKDDVEKQLRKEKADIELDFNKAKEMIAKKDNAITNKDSIIKNLESELKVKEKVISCDRDEINNLQKQYEDMRGQSTSRGIWNIVFCTVIVIGVILHFMF